VPLLTLLAVRRLSVQRLSVPRLRDGSQLSCTVPATSLATQTVHSGFMSVRGRILLVEDDPEAALFAVTVLAKRGQFEVTHTADPEVALELAAAGCWDLVFTDVDMPGMNGLELVEALRRIAPALPVAVLTAHVHLRTAALLCQADEFLTKPVRVDQLLATAAALIGRAAGS
jgi:CheY-like chemotaxis protein